MNVKRIFIIIILLVIVTTTCLLCYKSSYQNDKIHKDGINKSAKQAYSEVLKQYREVSEFSSEEYAKKAKAFPLVCSRAIQSYSDGAKLYYAFHDLNGDGLEELLIGSWKDTVDEFMWVQDILVYSDGQIHSVLDGLVEPENEHVTVDPAMVFEDKTVRILAHTNPRSKFIFDGTISEIEWSKEEGWYFKLNKEGTGLELTYHLTCENEIWHQKCYCGIQEISYDEWLTLHRGYDNLSDISYKILIES